LRQRDHWKDYLRLSLVNIGIKIYTATSSGDRISLRQIHKPSGKRIRYQEIVENVGPVETLASLSPYPWEGFTDTRQSISTSVLEFLAG
tara:strand:- start:9651 stop:9917 length:267 start_codon:yes stop_codon:yes gene_type:complete